MAQRTTKEAVEAILEVDCFELQPFIDTASCTVDELVAKGAYDETNDAKRLELIERWLSAHFYSTASPRSSSEKAGTAAESYQYKVDLYYASTMYGQQALALDTSGCLASDNKNIKDGKRTKIQVLGSPRSCPVRYRYNYNK